MEKVVLLIVGILVFGILAVFGVLAEETFNCTTTAECPSYDTGIYCNSSELCTSLKTSECVDLICVSYTNITCTTCAFGCQNGSCLEMAQTCDSGHLNLCAGQNECESAGGEWENGVCSAEETDDGRTVVTQNKTRISEKGNMTFVPWQKRNESECLEGCSCHGAVMSCPTETGKIMTIQAGRSGNTIVITIEKINVSTELELELENETGENGENETKLKAKLSNGRKAEIKIMPEVAVERALERLRLKVCSEEKNCTIELKEVGQDNKTQLVYELQAERHFRILAMFRTKAQAKAQVDAETGEITVVKKPWWAFLATEPEE